MKRKKTAGVSLAVCALAIGLGGYSWGSNNLDSQTGRVSDGLKATDTIFATSQVDRPSGRLTFLKILGEDGEMRVRVLDGNGIEFTCVVDESGASSPMGDRLRDVLDVAPNDEPLRVEISLRDEVDDSGGVSTFGDAGGNTFATLPESVRINNVLATSAAIKAQNDLMDKHRAAVQATRHSVRYAQLSELSRREGWRIDESELDAFGNQFGSIVRVMNAGDVARFTEENADLLVGIDLYQEGHDDSLATAMSATSANPGALQLTDSQGNGIGVWLTESGCPPSGFLSNYSLMSGSDSDHARNTTSILRAVSPSSWIYCKGGPALPNSTELMGMGTLLIGGRTLLFSIGPRVHIISQSYSWTGNNYDIIDQLYDDFIYDNSVLVVNSAGNLGTESVVNGPARGLNVLTVGNYNDANNTIASNSSGQNPLNTKNQKPEICAPGVNINAGGSTWSGTSQATPHVAGLLTDMQQAYDWLPFKPYMLRAQAIASSTDVIAGGKAVGEGGFDYLSGYYSFWDYWWSGGNGYFETAAANDANPSSASSLDVNQVLTAGQKVRVVLAWATRGTYTFDHRNDVHPIGTDLDLYVYSANGSLIAYSASFDNSYEIVNFTAPVSGTYQLRITRPFNRDTAAQTLIGLSVNW